MPIAYHDAQEFEKHFQFHPAPEPASRDEPLDLLVEPAAVTPSGHHVQN
jgi:hypothetical protein